MSIKDFLDKGVDLINKGAESAVKAIENKKQSIDKYNYIVSVSSHLDNMAPYSVKNTHPAKGREQRILELCLTITVEKSKLINSLIPVDETIINVKTTVEAKTQIDYMFVITNKRLWILNEKEYKKYDFSEITKCELINKSILSQGVNFNNNAFSFEGSEQAINAFVELLINESTRAETIEIETKRLCGITPKLELTTTYYTGITVGTNNEVVLHSSKDQSYLININDIEYMQILLDNKVVMTKGKKDMTAQSSVLMPCRKMSIKFKLKTKEYVIDIMPENLFTTQVKVEDSAFQEAYELSKNIITVLENMMNI